MCTSTSTSTSISTSTSTGSGGDSGGGSGSGSSSIGAALFGTAATHFCAAGDHEVCVAIGDQPTGLADAVCTSGAGC